MEQNVLVTVEGLQRDGDGEENRIELFTTGRYYNKNGVRYVSYDETEVSGMEGALTVLKLYPQRVVLLRMGKIQQKQEFIPDHKSHSLYVTPYGTMDMAVDTAELAVQVIREGDAAEPLLLQVTVRYELEIDGRRQSSNILSITIQGERRKHGY
ncbi:MAG TPA: DUF1934 domain-containing protein [Patescibacteria group bacterium]|nr:DUF1934 domain-containing protein [Patescibacteria group bacterium]